MNDKFYTIPQVAEILQMSKSKVYLWAQQRRLPTVKIGRNVRIRESDLTKWIEKNCILLPPYPGYEQGAGSYLNKNG